MSAHRRPYLPPAAGRYRSLAAWRRRPAGPYKGAAPAERSMSEDDIEDAVETFLTEYERAKGEYEQGYADADATLELVETHVATLREALEEHEGAE